jgi:hypothetical protein
MSWIELILNYLIFNLIIKIIFFDVNKGNLISKNYYYRLTINGTPILS